MGGGLCGAGKETPGQSGERGWGYGEVASQGERHVWEEVGGGGGRGLLGMKGGGGRGERRGG